MADGLRDLLSAIFPKRLEKSSSESAKQSIITGSSVFLLYLKERYGLTGVDWTLGCVFCRLLSRSDEHFSKVYECDMFAAPSHFFAECTGDLSPFYAAQKRGRRECRCIPFGPRSSIPCGILGPDTKETACLLRCLSYNLRPRRSGAPLGLEDSFLFLRKVHSIHWLALVVGYWALCLQNWFRSRTGKSPSFVAFSKVRGDHRFGFLPPVLHFDTNAFLESLGGIHVWPGLVCQVLLGVCSFYWLESTFEAKL